MIDKMVLSEIRRERMLRMNTGEDDVIWHALRGYVWRQSYIICTGMVEGTHARTHSRTHARTHARPRA